MAEGLAVADGFGFIKKSICLHATSNKTVLDDIFFPSVTRNNVVIYMAGGLTEIMIGILTRFFEVLIKPFAAMQPPSVAIYSEGTFWGDMSASYHWLFLDIDGVLHRAENGSLEFMPVLEQIALACPDLRIILSTSWRVGVTKETVLNHFPGSIRQRISGSNPDLDGTVSAHVRWHECMAVVRQFGLKRFTFIDDTSRLFPPDCPELFLTNRHEGLNAVRGRELMDRLHQHTPELRP